MKLEDILTLKASIEKIREAHISDTYQTTYSSSYTPPSIDELIELREYDTKIMDIDTISGIDKCLNSINNLIELAKDTPKNEELPQDTFLKESPNFYI